MPGGGRGQPDWGKGGSAGLNRGQRFLAGVSLWSWIRGRRGCFRGGRESGRGVWGGCGACGEGERADADVEDVWGGDGA